MTLFDLSITVFFLVVYFELYFWAFERGQAFERGHAVKFIIDKLNHLLLGRCYGSESSH